jgi:ABC-2 type transport system permease protein
MSKATPELDDLAPAGPTSLALHAPISFSALGVLFSLTLRQYLRGKRLLIIGVLFLLPSCVAAVVRYYEPNVQLHIMEFALVFKMIPQVLAPLAALLYASGMVQDEVEEQTLTYLLVRPLPKWAIYLTKLAATLLITAVLTTVFTALTVVVIHVGEPGLEWSTLIGRMAKIAGVMSLAVVGWCTLFGFISMIMKRALVAGIVYIILFEGILANQPLVLRKATVMFYFRVLVERWVEITRTFQSRTAGTNDQWGLDLATAPAAWQCIEILHSASAVITALAALLMQGREFHVKTPEGN